MSIILTVFVFVSVHFASFASTNHLNFCPVHNRTDNAHIELPSGVEKTKKMDTDNDVAVETTDKDKDLRAATELQGPHFSVGTCDENRKHQKRFSTPAKRLIARKERHSKGGCSFGKSKELRQRSQHSLRQEKQRLNLSQHRRRLVFDHNNKTSASASAAGTKSATQREGCISRSVL